MYHYIVRQIIKRVFSQLSKGDFEFALSMASDTVEHQFAGAHSLGGTRHTPSAMRDWFQRLFRLFPSLEFELHRISVSGWPWNTVCVAEWTDRATAVDGMAYENHGVHVVCIRWGKLQKLHAYLDTQVLADSLKRLADKGYNEAAAEPIED